MQKIKKTLRMKADELKQDLLQHIKSIMIILVRADLYDSDLGDRPYTVAIECMGIQDVIDSVILDDKCGLIANTSEGSEILVDNLKIEELIDLYEALQEMKIYRIKK